MSGQTEIMWEKQDILATEQNEWPVTTLEKYVRSISDTYKFAPNEQVVFLNTSDILLGKVLTREFQNSALLPGQAKKRIRKGDLLFSEIRPANGRFAVVDFDAEKYVVSTKLMVLRPNPEIDLTFLTLFLTSKETLDYLQLVAEDRSGTFPQITFDHIAELEIILPPLPEQRVIAGFLTSLNDKIDLLHRQNATLEALAETLFRQWFVEEAKEEWEDGAISDIIDFNPTYRLKKGELATYLEMSNVSSSTFNPSGWYKREFNSGTKFKNGDTLLARITPCLENGKTAFVSFLEEDEIAWGSTEYIIMRMKPQFHPFLSYVIARNSDFRDFAISSMSGSSGRQRVQTDMLAGYDIKIPDKATIQKMNEQLEAISNKLISNAPQIQTLSTLRDTLLPKLMSGEVRVAY